MIARAAWALLLPAAVAGAMPVSPAAAQAVTVKGKTAPRQAASVEACQGKTPHGFFGQEEEVTAGIIRFIGGGNY